MKKEAVIYIGFVLGAVLIALVVYIGTLRRELGLSEVILCVVALLFVVASYYVYMRLPQFRELDRRLKAVAAENRKLRDEVAVMEMTPDDLEARKTEAEIRKLNADAVRNSQPAPGVQN